MGSLFPGCCVLCVSCFLSIGLTNINPFFVNCNCQPVATCRLDLHFVCVQIVKTRGAVDKSTARCRNRLSKLIVQWQHLIVNVSGGQPAGQLYRCLPSLSHGEGFKHGQHFQMPAFHSQHFGNQTPVRWYSQQRQRNEPYVTGSRKHIHHGRYLTTLCLSFSERQMERTRRKLIRAFQNVTLWREIFRHCRLVQIERDCDMTTNISMNRCSYSMGLDGCTCCCQCSPPDSLAINMFRAKSRRHSNEQLNFLNMPFCFHLLKLLSPSHHPGSTDIAPSPPRLGRVKRESEECPVGFYGPDCQRQCHCSFLRPCHVTTGSCGDPPCSLGWMGDDCGTRMCPDGQYGIFSHSLCTEMCVCQDNDSCHILHGECADNECIEESKDSAKCAPQHCLRSYFSPPDCLHQCHCRAGVTCHPVTGTCPVFKCEGLYQPPSCEFQSNVIVHLNTFLTFITFHVGLALKVGFFFRIRK